MEVTRLLYMAKKSNSALIKGVCRKLAKFLGCCTGPNLVIGNNVQFVHNSLGTVLYTDTTLEDDVKIYQNVTLGKSDVLSNNASTKFVVHKGAVLCAGAKILCKPNEVLEIGAHSIVAANAVLNHSIPAYEIWGGYLLGN